MHPGQSLDLPIGTSRKSITRLSTSQCVCGHTRQVACGVIPPTPILPMVFIHKLESLKWPETQFADSTFVWL